eukprot:scaffold2008_cov283-Pinguiococcus_pyrenoidosus.AAC.8
MGDPVMVKAELPQGWQSHEASWDLGQQVPREHQTAKVAKCMQIFGKRLDLVVRQAQLAELLKAQQAWRKTIELVVGEAQAPSGLPLGEPLWEFSRLLVHQAEHRPLPCCKPAPHGLNIPLEARPPALKVAGPRHGGLRPCIRCKNNRVVLAGAPPTDARPPVRSDLNSSNRLDEVVHRRHRRASPVPSALLEHAWVRRVMTVLPQRQMA